MRIQENVGQRVPRLGSEVRFVDGVPAGRIKALNNDGFVVVRGKKRIRQFVFPYSSIATIGNGVVTLRDKKAAVLEKHSPSIADGEGISKKQFVKDIDRRLKLNNLDRAERIARITLYLTSLRLSQEQKKQLKKMLPTGIRGLWAVVEQPGSEQSFSMSDFLVPIKKQGRLQTMEEAYVAAREVFSSLRSMIPAVDIMEIPRSMPKGLQEIWESSS